MQNMPRQSASRCPPAYRTREGDALSTIAFYAREACDHRTEFRPRSSLPAYAEIHLSIAPGAHTGTKTKTGAIR